MWLGSAMDGQIKAAQSAELAVDLQAIPERFGQEVASQRTTIRLRLPHHATALRVATITVKHQFDWAEPEDPDDLFKLGTQAQVVLFD
jgi:hypothetical protein